MQWQMACTGRKWCDFVSYDPRSPEGLKLFIKRIPRDDCFIATSEEMVRKFLIEVDLMVEKLMNKLKDEGYDGIVINTDTWNDTGDENAVTSKQFIVFDEKQIKPI